MAAAKRRQTVAVPSQLVEHFLLGRAGPGELQRFTQDAGIVADVWLSFAADLGLPRRILFTPMDGVPAVDAAAVVHKALLAYRKTRLPADDPLKKWVVSPREWTRVAPLESYVAVTVYIDELIRVILPLTHWWSSKNLGDLRDARLVRSEYRASLESYIYRRLGGGDGGTPLGEADAEALDPDRRASDWKLLGGTSIVALIGLFLAVAEHPDAVQSSNVEWRAGGEETANWTVAHAAPIARAAVAELRRSAPTPPPEGQPNYPGNPHVRSEALIQRVFLDRETQLAETEAICTVKADAADRLFDISCRSLTWAIIDSGIAAAHPAFDEFEPGSGNGRPRRNGKKRVRATFDLTRIDRIRNFDLTTEDEQYLEMEIELILKELKDLPGQRAPDFDEVARKNLRAIGAQLSQRLLPDWALVEPLLRVQEDDGTGLSSDHGTHVAGILAADWRRPRPSAGPALAQDEEIVLRGVCPDISLFDLRVLHPRSSIKSTEFAIIAALEFVRYLNGRAAGPPLIHGVNISLSIPHEVRNYACGATPVCVACDDLVQSGVVVVAAAGNRGWNERELGFGNFVFCSITDPGNAQRVITVGATHRAKPHTYGVSYFSSRGPTGDGRVKPDLVAPGEKIRGPIRGGADDELDGTSMAAPFVSGAAAMVMSRNRELMRNPQRIKEILCASATDLGRERYFQGHGLVDVLRALQSI